MIARARAALSRQLSHPSGAAGKVVARLMNRGNRHLNDQAIARLDVAPGSRVLDLGFGGGLSFARLWERGATVLGVDRAADMVSAARERHPDAVQAGRLELHTGEVTQLPLPDDAVDGILTVNTVYFWPDLGAAFGELRRVLTKGGRLVIGMRDAAVMRRVDSSIFTLRDPEDVAAALRAAGFDEVEVQTLRQRRIHLLIATV